MRTDCFAYKKQLRNQCSVLKGDVNCFNCSFYKTKDKYLEELRKMENKYQIVRNSRGVAKKVKDL